MIKFIIIFFMFMISLKSNNEISITITLAFKYHKSQSFSYSNYKDFMDAKNLYHKLEKDNEIECVKLISKGIIRESEYLEIYKSKGCK